MVFRSYAGLVSASLTTSLSHAEAADPVALANSLELGETTLAASLLLQHLLLHATTGPVLDKAVTSGDGDGPKARHSPVARRGPKLRSRSSFILLELTKFDFTSDLLCKMEEYEGAVPTFQSVGGETGS